MRDIKGLPLWAQDIILTQQQENDKLRERIAEAERIAEIRSSDNSLKTPKARVLTVEGVEMPGRRSVTLPIGRRYKGSDDEFAHVNIKATVDNSLALQVMYIGHGDLNIRPQASNVVNLAVDYDNNNKVWRS